MDDWEGVDINLIIYQANLCDANMQNFHKMSFRHGT